MSNKRLSALFTLIFRCALICFVCAALAHAQTTINVPADQPTIQSAINVANNGDTVVVAPGTYIENLDFLGKAITVTSSDGSAVTIVDGNAAGPVATFQASEGNKSVLNGFTLQNGAASQDPPFFGTSGGGIVILDASPTVTNNVITRNHAICGIGIEIEGGTALIRGNTITGNTQSFGNDLCGGAGIEVQGSSAPSVTAPQIIGNTITFNALSVSGFGGGINVLAASPTIQNNYIANNSGWEAGGGVYLSGGSPLVLQNIIINNSTPVGRGAGVAINGDESSAQQIIGNTIVGNIASDGSSGIYTDVPAQVVISNNIVVAADGENGIVCGDFSQIFPSFSHNDITLTGTGGQTISSNCVSAAQGNGNISVDPLFVSADNGDYHLQAGSPAIDAGDNGSPNLSQQDYDGKTRVVDGNNDCVNTVDLGAYELQVTVAATFDPTSVSFGDQNLGSTSSTRPFQLSNTGDGCVSTGALTTTGDFAQSYNTCSGQLFTGQSCLVYVTFSPAALGTRTGTLSLSGLPGGIQPIAALSGTGVDSATASISPSSIVFKEQLVGTKSATLTFSVNNAGPGILHITSLTESGDPDFLVLSNSCAGFAVASGASCSVQIAFAPKSAGPGTATFTFTSDALNNPVSVSASGSGVLAAVASVSPSLFSFGDVVEGTQSPVQRFTVSNSGNLTLHVSGVSLTGDTDFSIVSNSCLVASGVLPGASCTIQVEFAPQSLGTGSASLTIASDATNNPVSVALSGTGVTPPQVTVSPASINFGNVLIGATSAISTVTVSNGGGATLHISSIPITGDADFISVSNNCTTGVLPGDSCTIQMQFKPSIAGVGAATLNIISDAANGVASVPLSGTGVTPAIASVSPLTINFGNQAVVTDSPLQTVTVSNTGSATLHVTSLIMSGDADFFTSTNNCVGGTGVAPGASCSVQMEFRPLSAGPGSATLTIGSDASNGAVSVSLSGTGVNPVIATVSPSVLNFGNQAVGTQSPTQTISLTNTGSGVITVSGVTMTGDPDLILVDNGCAGGFAAGITCSIQVAFAPKSLGLGSATLTINSDASNNPVSVPLSGTGVNPPTASVSPASINFGSVFIGTGNSTPTVTVSNTGGVTLHINSLAVAGDPDFFTLANNCVGGTGVAPGGSCTIPMEFQPHSAGPGSATLTIGSDGSNGLVSVALSGTGVSPATASVSPSTVNFGSQPVGTQSPSQTVTVSSTGTGPLHISSLATSGDADFSILNSNCPIGSGMTQGASCIIQVAFAPKSVGAGSATLTIGSDASNGPVSVALSGTGVSPATASVSPSAVNFGNEAVGTQSPSQVVTVSSTGTGPLHISSLAISGDADFSILSSNCPIRGGISPGATCFIDVAFAPRSLGPGSATLTINSDASNNPVSVPISGTGVNPPKASVSPASLSFGSLLPGTESAPQTITVSNIGGAALDVNSQLVTGDSDFFITNSNCVGPFIAPGGSCSIQVVFFPHSGGPGSATLTITSNDPAAPQQSVSLTGTGIDYAVSAPASLSVRSGDKIQTTVTVSAVGGNFSNAVSLSCSGLPSGASCSFSPASVVPGASSASSSLSINTQQSGGIKTPVGTYTITVNGTSSGLVHSAPITLTVTK